MKHFEKSEQLSNYIKDQREGNVVGFVPTMGALHEGHLSLLRKAKKESDLLVASVFVNPEQFENKKDMEQYPKELEKDKEKLKELECDVMFAPSVKEIYPNKPGLDMDFGHLERVMEGKYRPGHFKGVAEVVKRLFRIIQPNKAYFGKKDYQQLLIIKKMIDQLDFNIEVVGCPIIREKSGLALSSRNKRLNTEKRK
ncbi:MAG: pantoate--beta-alanine ligase, partial [Flavobacteriales bacterium]